MAFYLYYIDSVSPYLKEILQDLTHRYAQDQNKSFAILCPDMISSEDVSQELDILTASLKAGLKKSVTYPHKLLQEIFEEIPELFSLAEDAYCQKALFLALSQMSPEQEWDFRQCGDYLKSLRRWEKLRSLIKGTSFSHFKVKRLSELYQQILLERWNLIAPEYAHDYLTQQDSIHSKFSQVSTFKNLQEIIFLGFDYLSHDLFQWIDFFEKYFQICELKLYLPPPQTLMDPERNLEAAIKRLEKKADQVTYYQAIDSRTSEFKRFMALPQEWQEVKNYTQASRKADSNHAENIIVLSHFDKLYRKIQFWNAEKNDSDFQENFSAIPSVIPFLHLQKLLKKNDAKKKVTYQDFYQGLFPEFNQSLEEISQASSGMLTQYLSACIEKLQAWQKLESHSPLLQSYEQWAKMMAEEFKTLAQAPTESNGSSWVRHYRASGIKHFKQMYFPDFCESQFSQKNLKLPFIGEIIDPLQSHEMALCLKKLNFQTDHLIISFSDYHLSGRYQSISNYYRLLTDQEIETIRPSVTKKSETSLFYDAFYQENITYSQEKSSLGISAKDFEEVPGLLQNLHQRLERKPLSASYIDQYLKCPWKFFARWQVKVDAAEEEKLEISPKDKGLWMHRVFESLLKEFHSTHFSQQKWPSLSQLKSALDTQITQLRKELLKKNIEENFPAPIIEKELSLIQSKILALLQTEIETWENSPQSLFPHFFEWRFGEKSQNRLEWKLKNNHSAQLSGAIDRIDYNPQTKEFLVIDYKSSNTALLASAMRQGLSLQLFIYIRAVERHLLQEAKALGGVYWDAKSFKKDQGILNKDAFKNYYKKVPATQSFLKEEQFDLSIAEMEARLVTSLNKIYQGDYPLEPQECGAKQCPYHQACHYVKLA